MNNHGLMPGLEYIRDAKRRQFRRKIKKAALILGGIAAVIAIIYTK